MNTTCFRVIFLLFTTCVFNSCNSTTEVEKPSNNDSIINALNAGDTISKIPQKTIDSVNKVYLDSFKKHAADSNNAEYGSPR